MKLYTNMAELDSFTYQDCINWLQFNDPNGCYSEADQMEEFGELADLDEMKEMILTQSLNA